MSTIFERVRSKFQKTQEARAATFSALVAKIVDGKREPPVDEVEAVLVESGRTLDDLEVAVKLATERREWKRLLATCPEWDKRYTANQEALAAELQRFAQLAEEHDARRNRLLSEADEIRAKRPNHQTLQDRLWQSDDHAKHARHAELLEQQRLLRVRMMDLEARAREVEAKPRELGPVRGPDVLTDYQRLIDRAAELRAEAAGLKPEIERLGAEAEALRASSWE